MTDDEIEALRESGVTVEVSPSEIVLSVERRVPPVGAITPGLRLSLGMMMLGALSGALLPLGSMLTGAPLSPRLLQLPFWLITAGALMLPLTVLVWSMWDVTQQDPAGGPQEISHHQLRLTPHALRFGETGIPLEDIADVLSPTSPRRGQDMVALWVDGQPVSVVPFCRPEQARAIRRVLQASIARRRALLERGGHDLSAGPVVPEALRALRVRR